MQFAKKCDSNDFKGISACHYHGALTAERTVGPKKTVYVISMQSWSASRHFTKSAKYSKQ